MKDEPFFFGIRHLSPAGAYYLRQVLEERRPRLVLVEAPCDLEGELIHIRNPETRPPFAMLAYTQDVPVRTLLYPFSEYSPEYQAILWCAQNGVACKFMDLPAEVFLALPSGRDGTEGEEGRMEVYRALEEHSGGDGHETFWERTLEQADSAEGYHRGANLFGESLRRLAGERDSDREEIRLREAFMREWIREAVSSGIRPEDVVVVTGAYHVEGLRGWAKEPEREEREALKNMPRLPASHTLMPYSDYRLSSRSGYGAGNGAPAYFALIWQALCEKEPMQAAYGYLSRIAAWQREHGFPTSTAEVIEGVRLACRLAELRGGHIPALRDLRDAAVTCLGGGSMASISLAVADTEIGAGIGSLPEGVSCTSIQEDFYRQMRELKLEKYRDIAAQDLALDLRENRNVKSERAAYLDLNRSFFLHRLRMLGVCFATVRDSRQENATWAEHWVLRWTPEAEIGLVESALKGDTIAQAASLSMKERAESADAMSGVSSVIEDAFLCGMAEEAAHAVGVLERMAVDTVSVEELAKTAERLSTVIRYGSIRRVEEKPLRPILDRIFYRACLLLPGACVCDDGAVEGLIAAMNRLNEAALFHDFLNTQDWVGVLSKVARRDDLNTRLSGFAAAIMVERGLMDMKRLQLEVSRRLSAGTPADLGAGWFEGLAMKNRYALIARLPLWESLDSYLETLDDEEFKRALVFLRRAFSDFSAREKDEVAENLGELWGLNGRQVSEAVNANLPEAELTESLEGFDFDF